MSIPKSLGINPRACTPEGIASNFEKIIENFVRDDGIVRFRLTEFLQHGATLGAAAVIVTYDGTNYITGDTINVFDWYVHTNPLEPYDNMGWWWGEIGTEGFAKRREEPKVAGRSEYDIIWMECEHVVRFKLTSDLPTGNEGQALGADAVIRKFNGTAYEDTSVVIKVFDFQGQSPTGDASDRGMWQAITGNEGMAVLRNRSATAPTSVPQYDIIWMEQYAFSAEATLGGNLSGGTATATVTDSWEQGLSPSSPLTVHDDRAAFPDAISGGKAMISRSEYEAPTAPTTPYYKVVHCTHPVMFQTATLTANMCGDVPTVSGWTIKPLGDFKDDPGSGDIVNPYAHYGVIGDEILLLRWANTPPFTWAVIDVTKHEIQMMTGHRWNDTTKCLQRKQQLVAVETCEEESDWIDVLCFDPCVAE